VNEHRDRVIRASEIGQYVYCAHAWWLGSIEGLPSSRQQEMATGEAAHARHGRAVRTLLWLNGLAYVLLALALIACALWLLGK
jgi:hypothetical protein